MGNIDCCYGCKTRYEDCHDTCETYKKEKAIYEKKKAAMYKQKKLDADLTSRAIEGALRMKKKRTNTKWR